MGQGVYLKSFAMWKLTLGVVCSHLMRVDRAKKPEPL
jgi:hypothetical protein